MERQCDLERKGLKCERLFLERAEQRQEKTRATVETMLFDNDCTKSYGPLWYDMIDLHLENCTAFLLTK